MKTFVIGDIHGHLKPLQQCLKLSNFDKQQDRLICLGDVCDRGKQVKECIDELLTIPNCIFILGNHDSWALEWATSGNVPEGWWDQGGMLTAMSYQNGMPKEHIKFLTDAKVYFIDQNRLFVHAGFDPNLPIEQTPKEILIWDRTLIKQAQQTNLTNPNHKFGPYDEVYIGHTPTINFGHRDPKKYCNIWDIDTGAGHGAKLTIMDIDTKQFWQSS